MGMHGKERHCQANRKETTITEYNSQKHRRKKALKLNTQQFTNTTDGLFYEMFDDTRYQKNFFQCMLKLLLKIYFAKPKC